MSNQPGSTLPWSVSGAEKLEWVGLCLALLIGSLNAGTAPSSSMRAPLPGEPQSPPMLARTCMPCTILHLTSDRQKLQRADVSKPRRSDTAQWEFLVYRQWWLSRKAVSSQH